MFADGRCRASTPRCGARVCAGGEGGETEEGVGEEGGVGAWCRRVGRGGELGNGDVMRPPVVVCDSEEGGGRRVSSAVKGKLEQRLGYSGRKGRQRTWGAAWAGSAVEKSCGQGEELQWKE